MFEINHYHLFDTKYYSSVEISDGNTMYDKTRIKILSSGGLTDVKQFLLVRIYETIQELKKAQIELEKDLVQGDSNE